METQMNDATWPVCCFRARLRGSAAVAGRARQQPAAATYAGTPVAMGILMSTSRPRRPSSANAARPDLAPDAKSAGKRSGFEHLKIEFWGPPDGRHGRIIRRAYVAVQMYLVQDVYYCCVHECSEDHRWLVSRTAIVRDEGAASRWGSLASRSKRPSVSAE